MTKKSSQHKVLILISVVVFFSLALGGFLTRTTNLPMVIELNKPSEESFLPPGKDWLSEKKVEDYFIEHLRMSPEEAQEARTRPGSDGKVMLRLRENTTLEALLSNLEYYGLVRDKEALRYTLEHSEDTHEGRTSGNLEIGNNTISIYSYYRISEDMTAWEIADQLLNHPTYFSFDEYNYMFMP